MRRTFDSPIKLPLSTSTHLHSIFFLSHGKGGWRKSCVDAWLLAKFSPEKSHILHNKQKKIDTDACVTWKKSLQLLHELKNMSEMSNKSEIYSLTMECFPFTHTVSKPKKG